MKALITGISGFCGSHLAEHLLAQGYQVSGIEVSSARMDNLQAVLDRIDLHRADLRDREQMQRILAELQPDQIYHLAARTNPFLGAQHSPQGVGDSLRSGSQYQTLYEANVYGTINLLDAASILNCGCAVLITGSSAQYGVVPLQENPILETHPFRPVTHYAVTKATQDLLGSMYGAAGRLHVVRTRTFNIVGPRQSPQFVSSAFAQQVAQIEQGRREPVIEVGNLEALRDFVDVRDVVGAYRLALEHGRSGGAYNVSSGRGRSIRSLLDGLLAISTVTAIDVRQDPTRLQSADVPLQVGSYQLLRDDTGWQPEIAWEQTLRDLLEYWREAVNRRQ